MDTVTRTVSKYADTIMVLIEDDRATGLFDEGMTDFSELHTYCDANDYLQEAKVPFGSDPGAGAEGVGLVNAVLAEVSRRMAAQVGTGHY